jgi:hypothetical protein
MEKELDTFNGCSKVVECQNHECHFKQRDFHGISVWALAYKGFYEHCVWTDGKYDRCELGKLHDSECIQDHNNIHYPSGVEEYTKKCDDIVKEFNIKRVGVLNSLVPRITLKPAGTNRWMFVCEDFIEQCQNKL